MPESLKAAVVGSGFIGTVHVEALRRLGIEVTGIAVVRIVRRLLVVEHANSDTVGLLRQLGVIPFTTKLPAPTVRSVASTRSCRSRNSGPWTTSCPCP